MAEASPIFFSPSQQQRSFPTPSPLANSLTSTVWSSQPVLNISTVVLRIVAFVLSVIAAVSLTAPLPDNKNDGHGYGFSKFSEFRYAVCATLLSSLYSAFQLFKSICDVALRGHVVSDMVYDYVTFILDQLVAYLLISSSSVSVSATERTMGAKLKAAAVASVCMSFTAFVAMAICSLFSGYKLCKRIIW
ncbi:CASP-like protein 4A4 [Aristolochia californica]|uniref:CASP-like protein 4A4 n=1 Tax=Aristolochia californica TaxID=171875 RepID=UPI0035E1BCDC